MLLDHVAEGGAFDEKQEQDRQVQISGELDLTFWAWEKMTLMWVTTGPIKIDPGESPQATG